VDYRGGGGWRRLRGDAGANQGSADKCEDEKQRGRAKKGILGAGLALGALRLAATLLKPAVTQFISKR
jgi:hypothetical protein